MYKVIPIQKNSLKNTSNADISNADILEVWFDRIKEKDHKSILRKITRRTIPIIYKMENFDAEKIKENIVEKSKYVDIDIQAPASLIKILRKINPKIKVIISYHNYKETPYEKELKKLYKKMLKKGADIVKFATHAKGIVDSFRMLDFLSTLRHKNQEAICLCMGEHGYLTRISGHLFGNYMMYFAPSKTSKTAPGQITIKEFNALTL